MNRLITSLMAGALILGTATASFGDNRIADRKENQQDRIANGVANGSMTAHEAARVERQESRLNHEVRADRRANGGHLTNHERRQINPQQNGLSREIYRDKHNARHQ